jgi:hypothetical protein
VLESGAFDISPLSIGSVAGQLHHLLWVLRRHIVDRLHARHVALDSEAQRVGNFRVTSQSQARRFMRIAVQVVREDKRKEESAEYEAYRKMQTICDTAYKNLTEIGHLRIFQLS